MNPRIPLVGASSGNHTRVRVESVVCPFSQSNFETGALSSARVELGTGALSSARVDIETGALSSARVELETSALSSARVELETSALSSARVELETSALSSARVELETGALSSARVELETGALSSARVELAPPPHLDVVVQVDHIRNQNFERDILSTGLKVESQVLSTQGQPDVHLRPHLEGRQPVRVRYPCARDAQPGALIGRQGLTTIVSTTPAL